MEGIPSSRHVRQVVPTPRKGSKTVLVLSTPSLLKAYKTNCFENPSLKKKPSVAWLFSIWFEGYEVGKVVALNDGVGLHLNPPGFMMALTKRCRSSGPLDVIKLRSTTTGLSS